MRPPQLFLPARGSIHSPEHPVHDAAPLPSQRLQAPAGHHRPVLDQAVEYGTSGQSAIISGFQLSAILGKTIPRQSRCHAKSPISLAPGPASEILPDFGPSM
jgi:hypothetical protein